MLLISFLLGLALGGLGSPDIRLTALPESEVTGGCGCSFTLDDGTTQPVVWQGSDQVDASVGVNGEVVRTTRESHEELPKLPDRESVGDRFRQVQRFGELRVILDYETTWVCPENDEACEVTRYKGTLTVRRGKQRRSFKVRGDCGC